MDYFAHGYSMDEMGQGHGDNAWGWVIMVIVMAVVILGIVLLVRFASDNQTKVKKSSALDVLQQRYAKGDVNKKQFDEIKKDIE